MASYNDVIQGLLFFAKREGVNARGVCAEHDEVWAGAETPPEKLTPSELEVIKGFGWHYVKDIGGWRRFV